MILACQNPSLLPCLWAWLSPGWGLPAAQLDEQSGARTTTTATAVAVLSSVPEERGPVVVGPLPCVQHRRSSAAYRARIQGAGCGLVQQTQIDRGLARSIPILQIGGPAEGGNQRTLHVVGAVPPHTIGDLPTVDDVAQTRLFGADPVERRLRQILEYCLRWRSWAWLRSASNRSLERSWHSSSSSEKPIKASIATWSAGCGRA